jgi:hypothetical protein
MRGHAVRRIFKRPPGIHVICYLREFLDYAKSAYAQRIQATSAICSPSEFLRIFSKFSLSDFVERWQAVSDECAFVAYDTARKSERGVVDDFLSRIGFCGTLDYSTAMSNPTIGGHLLAFKVMVNKKLGHQSDYYFAFSRLAAGNPRYRGGFFISDGKSEQWRGVHAKYNSDFERLVGPVTLHSLERFPHLFDESTWKDDVDRFLDDPGLSSLREHEAWFKGPGMTLARQLAEDLN